MSRHRDRLSTRIAIVFARGAMITAALGIAFVGYTLLTTPWAIPVTVALWLGGTAVAALGVSGPLPHDAAGGGCLSRTASPEAGCASTRKPSASLSLPAIRPSAKDAGRTVPGVQSISTLPRVMV